MNSSSFESVDFFLRPSLTTSNNGPSVSYIHTGEQAHHVTHVSTSKSLTHPSSWRSSQTSYKGSHWLGTGTLGKFVSVQAIMQLANSRSHSPHINFASKKGN